MNVDNMKYRESFFFLHMNACKSVKTVLSVDVKFIVLSLLS
jgi:hypothetical protein